MEDIEKLLEKEQEIVHRAPCSIEVNGKVYFVRQISNKVRSKIADLEKEAFFLEKQSSEGLALRKAKRVDRKLRSLHAKTAAYYLLNNWALFVPFLWAVKWRLLDLKGSEYTFRINEAGMHNKGLDFFLANWQITKAQLVLSTRLVGEGLKKYQERMESVENMLEKDASGIKQDNK